MRKLLIAVIVLAALVLGGDAVARVVAEHRVAAELQSSFDLNVRPSVSIQGWPFLIHLIDGEFPTVGATATDVDKGGVVFSKVSVVLRRVHFTFPRALTGGHGSARAASGSGTAELTAEDLSDALRAHDIPVTVGFSAGHLTVSSSSTGIALEAPLNLDGTTLQIGPVEAASTTLGPFRLDLPTVVGGFSYASARVADDKVVLRLGIRDKTFSF